MIQSNSFFCNAKRTATALTICFLSGCAPAGVWGHNPPISDSAKQQQLFDGDFAFCSSQANAGTEGRFANNFSASGEFTGLRYMCMQGRGWSLHDPMPLTPDSAGSPVEK